MSISDPNAQVSGGRHTRREFIRRSTLLAGAGFAAPWVLDLAGLAGAARADDDYRAIVCLFMYGGNDHYDTFVPADAASHAAYSAARPAIAHSLDSLLPISPIGGFSGAGRIGFAPELPRLHGLFGSGALGIMSNIGTLVQPLDKVGWATRSKRPPQLFSHNDQQSFWQSSGVEGSTTGWGGRIGDVVLDSNNANSTFTCMSVSGNAVMLTGREAFQYQLSSSGVTTLRSDTFRTDAPLAGIRDVMSLQRPGVFPSSYVDVSRRALTLADELGSAISTARASHDLDAHFDTQSTSGALRSTAAQLRMVAQLIAAGRDTLGMKRQVFFVSMGGFDNHSGMTTQHRGLLRALDSTLAGFYDATVALGVHRNVTTFTASDFGRTLNSNGDGSDHGWGGHHIVMGGSVNGGRVYGDVPRIGDDGPDDVGRGRLLPTTAVDQYASTLAQWMGAGSSELGAIVPNIGRFASADLGFLRGPGAVDPDRVSSIDRGALGSLAPAVRIGAPGS